MIIHIALIIFGILFYFIGDAALNQRPRCIFCMLAALVVLVLGVLMTITGGVALYKDGIANSQAQIAARKL